MAQTFFPLDPVEVTPGVTGWSDVDSSAFGVPVGATGILAHLVNTSISTDYSIGLRKNGSTDDWEFPILKISHCWAAIGVDANRIFEAYVGDTTYIDIYLVGYTMSGVTFFTNGYNKLPATTLAWTDIDSHVEAPNAIGLIFEVAGQYGIYYDFGLRNNGSTDNHLGETGNHSIFGAIVGCDNSQICQGYVETNSGFFHQNLRLVGYITDGATFYVNAPDVSLDTIQTWLDFPALPANSVMGFIEVNSVTTGSNYYYGLRKNGSAENIYQTSDMHCWGFVACDANGVIEGKTITRDNDFYVSGYATKPYDETGKLQVILAIQDKTDVAIRNETAKEQVILAEQGKSDILTLSELGKEQVILSVTNEADSAIFTEAGKEQTILATQGITDSLILNELGKVQVILVTQDESDLAVFNELGNLQVILATQGITDSAVFNELAKLQVILGLHGKSDLVVFNEKGLLQVILAMQGQETLATFLEIREQVILAEIWGGVKWDETGNLQVILAMTGGKLKLLSEIKTPVTISSLETSRQEIARLETSRQQVSRMGISRQQVSRLRTSRQQPARLGISRQQVAKLPLTKTNEEELL